MTDPSMTNTVEPEELDSIFERGAAEAIPEDEQFAPKPDRPADASEPNPGESKGTGTDSAAPLATRETPKPAMRRIGTAVDAYADIDSTWRTAKAFTLASGRDDERAVSKTLAAILAGAEMGLPPAMSVRAIHVVAGRDGRVSTIIEGSAMAALLRRSGWRIAYQYEKSPLACEVTLTSPDGAETVTERYDEADAKTAGLWGKAGPWKSHPRVMLRWRALGNAARFAIPDQLAGCYATEEGVGTEDQTDRIDLNNVVEIER